MALTLDKDTILLIVLIGFILVLAVIILILTRKFSKKSLRRWLMEREDKALKSDKAFNSLLAVKTVSKNFGAQGIDVSSVKELVDDAEKAMKLKNYDSAIELAEHAKNLLSELKSKKEKGEEKLVEHKVYEVDAKEFASYGKEDYEPTTKEMLQKKYPQNFLQAKFTIGLTEKLLTDSKAKKISLKKAKALLEKSKQCFEMEDYDSALKYSLQCKKVLEGDWIEVEKTLPKALKKLECTRCKYESKEGDIFCRRCGNKLKY